jgi:hypothetical protein
MIRAFLFYVLLTISMPSWGQIVNRSNINSELTKTIRLDPLYFILGTLSDYMGRFAYVNKRSQIDRYYPYEKSMMNWLDEKIEKELSIRIETVPDTLSKPSLFETFSPELSSIINSYFNNNRLLLDSLLNSPALNCSYLTGRYLRYGRKLNDSVYLIQLANSADHIICDSLLRRAGCTKIHRQYLKNIPAQFIYYFIPSAELKNYYEIISKPKKRLDNSFNHLVRTSVKLSPKEFKKYLEDRNNKELKAILEFLK